MKNKEMEGTITKIEGDKVTIENDGVSKVYINNIFNLKVGDFVKYQTRFTKELDRVVIWDEIKN